MPKALAGASMLGADAALWGIATVMSGGFAAAMAPFVNALVTPLLAGGVSMEAGAIAQALTQQRGMNITTRQPAQYRQIVYGTQRVGGVIVYQSTTGGKHDQFNMVIVLATHVIEAIENLYLDGRQVFWNSGTGNTTRNGYNFGGSAATGGGIDGDGTYIGPNGQHYNFGTLVYCEARFGDQAQDDVIGALTANDPAWATGAAGSPWLGGCAYVYLKVEYDAAMFPQFPEIRFTLHGKNDIYDPRTGLSGYSSNAALIVNDILSGPTWGLGDTTVNQAQLIAAANVCDETLACAPTTAYPAGSLTEARYAAAWHYDTSTPPGEAIKVFLQAMDGRLSRTGGEWFLWPAYYQGPTATLDENILLAPPEWLPYREPDKLINRVNGTYIAPNYPYNIAGDLYDANGWYDGSIQNNFPFAFQPTNFPQYAADYLHGYASDDYLNQDSGAVSSWSSTAAYAVGDVVLYGTGTSQIYRAIAASTNVAPFSAAVIWNPLTAYTTGAQVSCNGTLYTALAASTGAAPGTSPSDWQPAPWIPYSNQLPLELELKAVLSVSQAQRLAKIELLRNRWQGTGSLKMKIAGYALQAMDTFTQNFTPFGWTGKLLEVAGEPQWALEGGEVDNDGKVQSPPQLTVTVPVAETDTTVYEWSISEELTVYDVPTTVNQAPYIPAAPTAMSCTSGASTAVQGADGVVIPRVLVEWTDPLDVYVTQIQVQYRLNGTTQWIQSQNVAVGLGQAYVTGVVSGLAYDFQIRSLRANGATSAWTQQLNYTVSLSLSVSSTSGQPVAPAGTLVAQALSGGGAQILVAAFSWTPAGTTLYFTPSPSTITGLAQGQTYYVYFVDPSFAGGTIVPIATQNVADFQNKIGYLLIGTIMTPTYTPLYRPTSFSDVGGQTSLSPAYAYDGNILTSALVSGNWSYFFSTMETYLGDCIWSGFPAIALAAAANLNVTLQPLGPGGSSGTTGTITVIAHVGGTSTTLGTFTGAAATQTLQLSLPSGTNLGTVSLEVQAQSTNASPPANGTGNEAVYVYEIWVQ
jgi:hypothetical protein